VAQAAIAGGYPNALIPQKPAGLAGMQARMQVSAAAFSLHSAFVHQEGRNRTRRLVVITAKYKNAKSKTLMQSSCCSNTTQLCMETLRINPADPFHR
jgi:hypothetical protein